MRKGNVWNIRRVNSLMSGTLFLSLFLSIGALCSAANVGALRNVETTLTVEKVRYLVGEPIVLTFVARYTGRSPRIELSDSDPYGQCGAYRLAVAPETPSREPASGPPCAPLFQVQSIQCLFGSLTLAKNADVKQRVLLNRLHDFTHPGTYTVEVTRHLNYAFKSQRKDRSGGEISATFTFTVATADPTQDLTESFSPYLTELSSGSYWRRQETATVVSSLAVPFLEPGLLKMLATPDLKWPAIRGLRRLNTEKGRRALFEVVSTDNSFSTDQQLALEALQEMGDALYGPLLLNLRNRSTNTEERAKLLVAAARLDPAGTMPSIQPLLKSPETSERENGAAALAAMERPEAIPILAGLLADSSLRVRSTAASGLVSLTRRTPSSDGQYWTGKDPATAAPFWSAWMRENPQLPVNPIRLCPQMDPK